MASLFLHGVEVDVTYRFLRAVGRGHAVDADVDHHGALAHVIGGNQPGLAGGDDEDVCIARVGLQVPCRDVADRDGGHLLGQEQGDGFAGDLAAPTTTASASRIGTPVDFTSSTAAIAVQGAMRVCP